mmetsp:Transcript_69230/g.124815  ORF Transcript_69230/g.124815 Transcript_69230/m.124815 type:complete len:206 (-) Transcript_69230:634-1251(-)
MKGGELCTVLKPADSRVSKKKKTTLRRNYCHGCSKPQSAHVWKRAMHPATKTCRSAVQAVRKHRVTDPRRLNVQTNIPYLAGQQAAEAGLNEASQLLLVAYCLLRNVLVLLLLHFIILLAVFLALLCDRSATAAATGSRPTFPHPLMAALQTELEAEQLFPLPHLLLLARSLSFRRCVSRSLAFALDISLCLQFLTLLHVFLLCL